SVRGLFGHPNTVHLDTKACTCQVFQKLKIPCGHAMLAAASIGLPYTQLVGDCYKTHHWIDTYSGVILPEAPLGDHPIPLLLRMSPFTHQGLAAQLADRRTNGFLPQERFMLPRNPRSSPTNVVVVVALAITALAVLSP
ncbi:unnamed protein product, partial [Brassica oleracea var. botrytis]